MASSRERSKIGVFGGTFDPPHLGHLVAAQEARETLSLDRLLFIPACRSPHRMDETTTPAETRLAMVRAAIRDVEGFDVDDIEVSRGGPSYTIDTLEALSEREGDAELYLLMGADQWASFARWRRPDDIARLAHLVLLSREGDRPSEVDPGLTDGRLPPFVEVPMTRLDISASLVRSRVRGGRSIRFLVPAPIRRIIEVENLYLSETPGGSE